MDFHPMIRAARVCLGTPFQHQGRVAGVGLDCLGLVIIALQAVGKQVRDRTDYGMQPDGATLRQAFYDHGGTVVTTPQLGHVLLFRIEGAPRHVGIATSETSFIHSYAPAGKVIETSLGVPWRRRIDSVWRCDRFPLIPTIPSS